jgi:hypothetical protein
MLFRILSDIHNEVLQGTTRQDYSVPPLDTDPETVLILAGDIGVLTREHTWLGFLTACSRQFRSVFIIEGNQEYYHGHIEKNSWSDAPGRHSLQNIFTGEMILREEKIAIIGTTLWTDFEGGEPISMFDVGQGLNDYHLIRAGARYSRLRPEYTLALRHRQKSELFRAADRYRALGYTVMAVTHHQPSRQAIMPAYRNDRVNGGFVSSMDHEILQHDIAWWISGHCHTAMEYSIGKTRVLSNPKGYPHEHGNGFDPLKTLEIAEEGISAL